ncbi:MAG: D-tyrosyl-tRNA(Tyr) deacylase [Flammeovirgaceae bacterium]|nr:D-tyrosyl-tRNA(Tyr) deacylase [Flammeovirgaceae bacterium]
MIVVIQKVTKASVTIENKIKGQIPKGLMILLGVTHDDNENDIEWLSSKVVNLRIFNDEDGKMNRSILDVGGNILLVSQFTLHASTKKGNRPGYNDAAKPDIAIPLYEKMIVALETKLGKKIAIGEFGAMMEVSLVNDGPVTIIIDSKNKR